MLRTLLLSGIALAQAHTVNLNASSWTISNGDNVTDIRADFPSQAHLDLYRAGVIGDPIYGFNDDSQLWVQRSNWTWHTPSVEGLTRSSSSSSSSNALQTWLVFEGLDTFAHIQLCGQQVANTDNMYRKYSFDVSHILARCHASVDMSINFGSASKIVLDIAKRGPGNVALMLSCSHALMLSLWTHN